MSSIGTVNSFLFQGLTGGRAYVIGYSDASRTKPSVRSTNTPTSKSLAPAFLFLGILVIGMQHCLDKQLRGRA